MKQNYEVQVSYNDLNGYDQEVTLLVSKSIDIEKLEDRLYEDGFMYVDVDTESLEYVNKEITLNDYEVI